MGSTNLPTPRPPTHGRARLQPCRKPLNQPNHPERSLTAGGCDEGPVPYVANPYLTTEPKRKRTMPFRLQDRVVVLTGAASGIGAALAKTLALKGAQLAL